MWDPEDCARNEGWEDGFQAGLKEAVKVTLAHKCSHSCADRGAGVTCSWEIAEDLKARLKPAKVE
jgi:hypothetical protein